MFRYNDNYYYNKMCSLLDKIGGEGDNDGSNEDCGNDVDEDDGANGTTKLPVLVLPTALLSVSITCSV